MYDSVNITSERVATYNHEIVADELELGNSKLGFGIIMVMAAFVGVWGIACLIGGLSSSGNLHAIGRGLITALTGI